ncbi:PhoPQ-activated pathogenicity-related family protein [Gemmata sp.]|uniref:PhoPQ-activated pathogenicity-related family protein n=1 Tax=Gemmata sp. TaxID=1914242 RepID=UPI003F6FB046
MTRLLAPLLLAALAGPAAAAPQPADAPRELTDYVGKADASYSWKLVGTTERFLGTVYELEMVSQTWHDTKWDHKILVMVPKGVKPQATMVLWNEGDAPDGGKAADLGLMIAGQVRAPVAFLYGVPKQPLYGGKKEDALIAESFVRYLDTEDGSWPLLFPMVKSVVRGMDALQAFAKQEWKFEVKDFVVAGASKRGWTAWLTAATGDPRVKAIAPLVFDSVHIAVQMDNQVKAFGKPSEMIRDYAERKLVPIPRTAAAARLWQIIDPWSYRDRLTMPKLIVCGTNDPYWPLDALNSYWDGLKGDKWILYVPNAGHHLCERDKDGKEEKLPLRTIATVCAFCRSQVFDKPLPKVNCDMVVPPGAGSLDVSLLCDVKPLAARVFSATALTRDFRKSFWEDRRFDLKGASGACKVDIPAAGLRATLVEMQFQLEDLTYTLSTPLRILEAPKK